MMHLMLCLTMQGVAIQKGNSAVNHGFHLSLAVENE